MGKFVGLRMTVDVDTLILGVLLSATMAVLGGFLPAVSAFRLLPLEALK